MPQSPRKNPTYFTPNTTASTPSHAQEEQQSMAATALKAFVKPPSKSSFHFTTKPITRSEKTSQEPAVPIKNPLSLPPQGLLSVKIIAARALAFASSRSRPYVFAQFDNNEFASREPIGEEEEETRGIVKPTSARPDQKLRLESPDPALRNQSGMIPTPSDGNGLLCLSGQNPIWKQEVDFDVTHHQPAFSTHHSLYLSIYDRSLGDTHSPTQKSTPTSTTTPTPPANTTVIPGIEGVELFLGETEIKLDFQSLSKAGGWVDQWYPLTMKTAESSVSHASGEIRIQLRYRELRSKKSLDVGDFEFLKMIGKGTFGRVFQVRKKDTRRIYAMKVLSKKEVIDKKEVQHTIGERNILQQSSKCPFLLGLKFSFQSPGELFLVMDYKSGGELFHHLQKEGRFTEERARFYTAEIVLALEHLHKYNIVYRDLKPENILLDATGHIVLCDFGLSKPNLNPDELTTTFCGTTEYLAPEVLLDDHGYSKLVDFWSLGVLLFEMCCGWSPFYAEDNQQMYKNICFGKIKFPRGVIGDEGKQFVKGLLNRNPKHRLGSQNDTADLKVHEFFRSIDWEKLSQRQVIPVFKPHIESDESVSNFDVEFTQLNISEHLPTTIKERLAANGGAGEKIVGKCFDESDRSDDWVKKASYVPAAALLTLAPSVASSSKKADPQLPSTPAPPLVIPPVAPVPLPLKPAEPAHDQDQFLGFSYHGESELATLANSHSHPHPPNHIHHPHHLGVDAFDDPHPSGF
ncbi:hypothetical protein PtB15_10B343 [Puccinia triticina]|nr:hypothetical protein PtB15_10B343 [Puccinia triticina]